MRLLAALCVLGLAGCGDNRTTPAAGHAPTPAPPSTTTSTISEPARTATGPVQATIPEEFRGRWDATAESCGRISDAELKVTDRTLSLWEGGVAVRAVTPVGANIIRVEGTGDEELETYEYSSVFQLSVDGSVLTMNPGPHGFARVRCLTPDFPEAETR